MDVKRRPGYLAKYAEHAKISRQAAAEKLYRVSIDYLQPFDFDEADRRIQAAAHADRATFSRQVYGAAADDEPIDPETRKHPKFVESQACREMYRAKLIELEYLERLSRVVDRERAQSEFFRVGQLVRDAMRTIPDRVSGKVAAESDHRKVKAILHHEIEQALITLIDQHRIGGLPHA